MQLKVFSPRSLANAPARRSNLSLLAVAGVILFYLGTVVATQLAVGVFYRPSRGAASSRPAPVVALTAPATQDSPPPPENAHMAMLLQIADAFTKILPVIVILWLSKKLVAGGIDGWGLSVRKIPRGVAYGFLGLLVTYPLLVVLNIFVTLFIEHFQKRKEETHETLQLLVRHDISTWERITFLVVAGVIAPILEEIFFRGLLQTVFMERSWGLFPQENAALAPERKIPELPSSAPPSSPVASTDDTLFYQSKPLAADYRGPTVVHRWLAILATSFIFAGIHLMPDSFLVLFALAIALGYVYERTNNLWACITLHAAFNCLNIYLFTRG